jgi:glycosyltransferase involved in cell wall biosynthesis
MTNIALIIPCLNEAKALPVLFQQISQHLPEAKVHIFDNGSTDATVEIAHSHGAVVHSVFERGKGRVVARMFSDVDADVYMMVDGDATYDLAHAKEHIDLLIRNHIDMLVGSRMGSYRTSSSRKGHKTGNMILSQLLNKLFEGRLNDVLSGYRIMSRRFVKTTPVMAEGFEIEVMLTIHALDLRCHVIEMPIQYMKRIDGTVSKLNTVRDGWTILMAIIYYFKEIEPFRFFTVVSIVLSLISLLIGIPVVIEFFGTGLVPRFPSAILAASLMLAALISFSCGLVLSSVAAQRRELKRLFFLQQH